MKYNQFIFKDYAFDQTTKTLTLHYGYDSELVFTETYTFDFEYVAYDPVVLDRAIQQLFFMAGISYFKMYLAPAIAIEAGSVDESLSQFLNTTYQKGLGEFFYINQLDPLFPINFPVNSHKLPLLNHHGEGILVGLGGGKDSLLTVEALMKDQGDLTTWSLNHRKQLEPLVQRVGTPHLWVDRTWDLQIMELNSHGAYNGHVPISAIFACVGSVAAILAGKRDAVVSNEYSANEATLTYKDVSINHQYSKSQAFENEYQHILGLHFGETLRYYSFLRSLSELSIAERFAAVGFKKYFDVFSSCNKAFTHTSPGLFWDGTCPKCAFVFLALTPFVERTDLERLFSSNNLLLDPSLVPTYYQLLGIEGDKPLECIGEIKESRAAMRLAQKIYPELASYQFEIPESYDFRALQPSSLPADIAAVFQKLMVG